jgi:hypothetical protein
MGLLPLDFESSASAISPPRPEVAYPIILQRFRTSASTRLRQLEAGIRALDGTSVSEPRLAFRSGRPLKITPSAPFRYPEAQRQHAGAWLARDADRSTRRDARVAVPCGGCFPGLLLACLVRRHPRPPTPPHGAGGPGDQRVPFDDVARHRRRGPSDASRRIAVRCARVRSAGRGPRLSWREEGPHER